jgi:LEA14-like dessication related protein
MSNWGLRDDREDYHHRTNIRAASPLATASRLLTRYRMLRIFALIIVSLLSVGCAALNVQKPTAAVTGMTVQDVNASGFTMNFDVDLKNPNSMALPLTAADYKLGLGGTNVLEGKAKPEGSIPAGGSKHVTLPVTVTYENLLAAEQGIMKSGGNVPYALDAGLSLNSGTPMLGNLRVPIQYNGTLPLKEILNNPQAVIQNPAAQKLAGQLLGGLFSH